MIVIHPKLFIPKNQMDISIINKVERYGRVCYKSEEKSTDMSATNFVKKLILHGHESVLEHEKLSILAVVDRGVTHEIVRHRVASYSQESTRYCNYSLEKFGQEITVIEPFFLLGKPEYVIWEKACTGAERAYMNLLLKGFSPQEARSVLPNSLKTEIVITYNIREWRHFFRLRCSKQAHPQMRQMAIPLLLCFQKNLAAFFEDIQYDDSFPPEHYATVTMTDDYFMNKDY